MWMVSVTKLEQRINSTGVSFTDAPAQVNTVNGKSMTRLLEETRKNTAYLRRFV